MWKGSRTDQRALIDIVSYHTIAALGLGARVPRALLVLDKPEPYKPPCPFDEGPLPPNLFACQHLAGADTQKRCLAKARKHSQHTFRGLGAAVLTEKLPAVKVLQIVNLTQCFLDDGVSRQYYGCDVPVAHHGDIGEFSKYCKNDYGTARTGNDEESTWNTPKTTPKSCSDTSDMEEFVTLGIVDYMNLNMDRYWKQGYFNNLFSTGDMGKPFHFMYIDNAMQWLGAMGGYHRDGMDPKCRSGSYLFDAIRLKSNPRYEEGAEVKQEQHNGPTWKGGYGGPKHNCAVLQELKDAVHEMPTGSEFITRMKSHMGEQQISDMNYAFSDSWQIGTLGHNETIMGTIFKALSHRYDCVLQKMGPCLK
jgi:hypothetical protein